MIFFSTVWSNFEKVFNVVGYRRVPRSRAPGAGTRARWRGAHSDPGIPGEPQDRHGSGCKSSVAAGLDGSGWNGGVGSGGAGLFDVPAVADSDAENGPLLPFATWQIELRFDEPAGIVAGWPKARFHCSRIGDSAALDS